MKNVPPTLPQNLQFQKGLPFGINLGWLYKLALMLSEENGVTVFRESLAPTGRIVVDESGAITTC
jgi:hypothetical protein